MQRDLSSLSRVSAVVVLAIAYLVLVVALVGGGDGDDDEGKEYDGASRGDVRNAFLGPNFFEALPIIVLAFGNQVNVHEVVRGLERPTPARVKTLIYGTNALVGLFYLVIGVGGYSRFGGLTEDNILSNYHGLSGRDEDLLAAARCGIVIVVLFSYPMLLVPCRSCLHAVLQSALRRSSLAAALPSRAWFAAETLSIVALTFLVSAVVPVLGEIMGYTGAIAGTLLGFTFPALYHSRLCPRGRTASKAMVVLGVAFGLVCFGAQISSDSQR